MDDATLGKTSEQFQLYSKLQVEAFIRTSAYAALVYHHITSFDEEVKYIWPQPTRKLGKILFLATRYSILPFVAAQLTVNVSNYARLSTLTCYSLFAFGQGVSAVVATSAEVSLWVCLYALLGAKPKYAYLITTMVLCFMVASYATQCIYSFTQKAIPRDIMDNHLGWPCAFTPANPKYLHIYSVGVYLSAARAFVAIALGLLTLAVRYQKRRSNLLRAITVEGGLYLVLTMVVKLISALDSTRRKRFSDKFQVIWITGNLVLRNVFAERLLLSLRKIDKPGTQAVMSTIHFRHTDGERSAVSTVPENATENDAGGSGGDMISREDNEDFGVEERSRTDV